MPLFQRCAALLDASSLRARWHTLRPFRQRCASVLFWLYAAGSTVLFWLFVALAAATNVGRSPWVPTSTQWLILALVASLGLTVFWLLFWWMARRVLRLQREHLAALRQRLLREEGLLPDAPPDD
jgi:hypothetical protein